MECERDAIAGSRAFMADAGFDPCVNICGAEQDAFERSYLELFTTHLARKKIRSCQLLQSANTRGQKSRFVSDTQSSTATFSGSASSSVVSGAVVGATSDASPSTWKVHSNLATLLGQKKDQKVGGVSSSGRKGKKVVKRPASRSKVK